jgi:hypothetical protein
VAAVVAEPPVQDRHAAQVLRTEKLENPQAAFRTENVPVAKVLEDAIAEPLVMAVHEGAATEKAWAAVAAAARGEAPLGWEERLRR